MRSAPPSKLVPDGSHILLGTSSIMAASPALTLVQRFDPVNSVKELIAYAKANPNKLSYSSSGVGSTYHLGAELFSAQTGIAWTHVPCKGAAPAAQDLVAGHVQVMFDALSSAVPNMKAGRVKGLGIASLKRSAELPDLPTISEAGVPGYETVIWLAFFLHKDTPAAITEKLREALLAAMQSPGIREKFTGLGMQPTG